MSNKKFSAIKGKETPASRKRIDILKKEMLAEVRLQDLRNARALSQASLAEIMDVAQSEISKIEKRTDLYVSTLRSYLEAMGAELHIVATFPEGEKVEITQFSLLAD